MVELQAQHDSSSTRKKYQQQQLLLVMSVRERGDFHLLYYFSAVKHA